VIWLCTGVGTGPADPDPDPLAVFNGPTSKGKEGVEGGEGICRTSVKLLPIRTCCMCVVQDCAGVSAAV